MSCILVALAPGDPGDEFISALLPNGFEVYVIDSKQALQKAAERHNPDVLVIDYDSEEYGKATGLEEIRNNPKLRPVRIVLYSTESGLDFVKATMRFGVVGYLPKPISHEELCESLGQIISKSTGGGKRREFVRVKPASCETVDFELFLDDIVTGIGGEVMDISIGGVACRLRNPKRASEIVMGNIYPRMEIGLTRDRRVRIGVTAVIARGDTVAFRITQMDESALQALCRYIHRRLLEGDSEDASTPKGQLKQVL